MNGRCSIELLESALAGSLPADDEVALQHHLETCNECNSTIEHLAGGTAWCSEAASLLAVDELDAEIPVREEFSEIDFTVEHLEPSDDPNALGQLGGYDVLEVIGRGGMGVVLKGYDRELKRCVAVKVLAPHLAQSSLAKKRFAREAQAAAAVVHPNVLAIHQVQPTGRLPFLVMPLVAGESLAQRLTAKGSLELAEVLRIGLQAAAGLAAAHEQGLVHRDVKPANILLEKGVERAVLTDFGLARAADDVALTRWGIIAGTPQYMSPEQAKGEPVDGRSDLFSLGVVLYEMATGVSPFRTDSTISTLRRLIDEEPQAMSSLNPELPPWFIGIVEKLLEKDPSKRFSSAKEVCDWLEGCLAHVQQPNNVPLPAGLPTVAVQTKPRWSIRRWIATIAATLLLGAMGAGAVMVATADPPDISGEWNSDEWGRIVLKQTSPREYTGAYFLITDQPTPPPQVETAARTEERNAAIKQREELNKQIEELNKKIGKLHNEAKPLIEEQDSLRAKNDALLAAAKELAASDPQREQTNAQVETNNARLEKLGARLGQLNAQFDPDFHRTMELTGKISEIDARIYDLSDRVEAVKPSEGKRQAAEDDATTPQEKPPTDRYAWFRDRLAEKQDAAPTPTGKNQLKWSEVKEMLESRKSDPTPTGEIQLKWSRIERQFTGTWKEGQDRFGDISVQLVDNEIRGAYTTSRESKVNPATPKLAPFAWVRPKANASKIPVKLVFGPVIERIVNDDDPIGDFLIDLDNGKLASPPKFPGAANPKAAYLKWCSENGIDATGETTPSVRGLVGYDMIAVPTPNHQWDCTPEFLLAALAGGKPGMPVTMSGRGELPSTYLIQTREGGKGVLQITGFTDSPRGVKIRYKLLSEHVGAAFRAQAEMPVLQAQMERAKAELKRIEALYNAKAATIAEYEAAKDEVAIFDAKRRGDEVRAAEIRLAAAKRYLERARKLAAAKAISAADLAKAESDLAMAEAELKAAIGKSGAGTIQGTDESPDALAEGKSHERANLRGKSFPKLVLKGTDRLFSGADLRECNFERATLVGGFKAFYGTNFSAANLSGATLSGKAAFQRAVFDHANLSGTVIDAGGAGFQEASFKGATLENAKLFGGASAFQLASFQQADLTGAVLDGSGGAFQGANFDSATLHGTKIVCNSGSAFQVASLNNTDFSGADLITVDPQALASCRFAPDSPPKYSAETKLPVGFDPVRAGWKKVEPGSVSKARTTISTDKSDITNTIHNAEIELLETELRRTKQELAHTKALYDAKAATAADYKAAKDAYDTTLAKQEGSAVRAAEIRLAAAKHRMERAKKRAEAKEITIEELEKAEVELAIAEGEWLKVAPARSQIEDDSTKVPNSAWSFGPTAMKELCCAGRVPGALTFALQLTEGRVFNLPKKFAFFEDPTNVEDEKKWVAETKINLVIDHLQDTDQWVMRLHKIKLAELPRGSWQALSADELQRRFAELQWQPPAELNGVQETGFYSLKSALGTTPPMTFAYQTSDGQRGIFQFYAANSTETHRVALVRFRPLQKAQKEHASQRTLPNESKPAPSIEPKTLTHRVPFELGATLLKDGDRIEIEEVRGTTGTMKPGNIYEVTGSYRLASTGRATLYAGVTISHQRVDGVDHFDEGASIHTIAIHQGTGSFSVRFRMQDAGFPHISFYPAIGNGFAHVYFGTGDSVLRKGWWEEKKNRSDREYPKLAPYPAIRWPDDSNGGKPDQAKPTVQIDGHWSELQSINDLSVEEIVKFAQKQYESRWKKRFNEDLVQVLTEMGHPPGDTVKLVVRDVESGEVKTLDKVPMTRENRQAIWQAEVDAESRSGAAKQPASSDPLAALDAFEAALNDRWSYRHANKADFAAAIADLRAKVKAGLPNEKFRVDLQKIIALGIDGHASVSGGAAPAGGYLPFLIEPSGFKLVAFTPDRNVFLANNFPYVTAIDGKDIAQWCNAARALVPKGSEQYILHHCLRELRNLDGMRDLLSLPKDPLVIVELESKDGTRRESLTLPVANRPGTYDQWPRGTSKLLDDNIGNLRLPAMNRRAVNEIKEWMPKFRDTAGLIVDVRDNGGGSRDALLALYSYLAAPDDPPRVVTAAAYRLHPDHRENHLAQRFMYRSGAPEWSAKEQQAITEFAPTFKPQWTLPAGQFSDWHYMVLSRNDDPAVYHYNKPVCVLMNAKCFSATDIFLAGLKGIKNVTLMGTPSGGGSALSKTLPLANSPYRVRIGTMASFQSDGKLFDGNGVQPDVLIDPTPEYYIGGPDNVLATAMKRIRES